MRVVSYTRFTTDAVGVEVPANAIQLQTEEIENYVLGLGFQIEKSIQTESMMLVKIVPSCS